MNLRKVFLVTLAGTALSTAVVRAETEWGLKEGTPDLASAGPLAFGPDGVLFVGDTKNAAIFAIGTGDTTGEPAAAKVNVEGLNAKIASVLGKEAEAIVIRDLVANPLTGNVFVSVMAAGQPHIVKVSESGKIEDLGLKKVKFLKASLPNAPEDKAVEGPRGRSNPRDESITDLAYTQGKVYVSGVAVGGKSPSNVREIAFPFAKADEGSSVEIYHGAHGKFEDYATIRTFLPMTIDGEPSLLAGFVCTPLVKFPVASLKPGEKTRGTTVAELGNRNRPLDMIMYQKDGKDFLLMANSARGVMKISTADIARKEGITERVNGTAGQTYETIKDLQGVVQLDKLNDSSAVVLVQTESGAQHLKTVALP